MFALTSAKAARVKTRPLVNIEAYRREQGLEEYDEIGRGWRQLVLKKKSSGPRIGAPVQTQPATVVHGLLRSRPLPRFHREHVFNEVYDIPWYEMQKILGTDNELMLLAFRFLRQAMFGEQTIAMRPDALDKRLARKREREAQTGNQDVPTGGE